MIFKTIFLISLNCVVIVLLSSAKASALDCRPFEIYPDIKLVKPSPTTSMTTLPSDQILNKISLLPGHKNFPNLYRVGRSQISSIEEQDLLNCVYSYLVADFDKDGVLDWKVATDEQLFDRPIPQDTDWDNDGLDNFFDSSPFKPDPNRQAVLIPNHLKLHKDNSDPLNLAQEQLLSQCGILAINHTDHHSISTLNSLLKICERFFTRKKPENELLIVYAFAGHTVINDSVASFFPQLNFMSVGGQSIAKKHLSDKNIIGTLAHELGHYFVFKRLKTEELVYIAKTYGHWNISDKADKYSKFNPAFINEKANHNTGFFPSEYSKVNIHEWFSEVFSLYIQRSFDKDLARIPELPSGLEEWIKTKLHPGNISQALKELGPPE